MDNGFNNIQSEWLNSYANLISLKGVKKFIIPFKYEYETLSCYMCFNLYTSKCNVQYLNNDFNKLEVDDLIHVKMLILQEMWKNSLLNHSSILQNIELHMF